MPYKNKRVDIPLVKVSDKYVNEGFICETALTELPVKNRSGILAKYGNVHLQLVRSVVEERGEYLTIPTVERDLSDTYYVKKHGLHDIVTEDDYMEVMEPFEAESDVVENLESLLMIEKEHSIATALRATATYPAGHSETLSGNAQWDDYTNSNPIELITTIRNTIFAASGKISNAAIIPWDVMQKLRYHPRLISATNDAGQLSQFMVERIKALLELDYLAIPKCFYVNASGDFQSIWGKDAIFYHKSPTANKKQRTFAYSLFINGKRNRVFKLSLIHI